MSINKGYVGQDSYNVFLSGKNHLPRFFVLAYHNYKKCDLNNKESHGGMFDT